MQRSRFNFEVQHRPNKALQLTDNPLPTRFAVCPPLSLVVRPRESVSRDSQHLKKQAESSPAGEQSPESKPGNEDLLGNVSNAAWYGVGMAVLAIAIIVPTLLLHDELPREVQKWTLPSMIPMTIVVVAAIMVIGFQMIRHAIRWFRRR